jgi:hypothetical protein
MNLPLTLTISQLGNASIFENTSLIMHRVGDLWCTLTHDSVMWPIHGQYQCRRLGRRKDVAWARSSRPQ